MAGKPADDPDALQAMAYALVARALLGDGRAGKLLFDLVDGRPIRRREVRTSSTDGIGPEAIEAVEFRAYAGLGEYIIYSPIFGSFYR